MDKPPKKKKKLEQKRQSTLSSDSLHREANHCKEVQEMDFLDCSTNTMYYAVFTFLCLWKRDVTKTRPPLSAEV